MNMLVEEDGDEVFTPISRGCVLCPKGFNGKHPPFIKRKSPGNSSLRGGGPLYWVCPIHGYFGEVK